MHCHDVTLNSTSSITATVKQSATQAPVFDQPILPAQILETLLKVQDLHQLALRDRSTISPSITRYPLYPIEGGQPWTIELFDCSGPITAQYHKIQTKLFLVVEGTTTVQVDSHEKTLQPGQLVRIFPGSTYSLTPSETGCRFLCLSMPALGPNEDVFTDAPHVKARAQYEHTDNHALSQSLLFVDEPAPLIPASQRMNELNKNYFPLICPNGANTAYDLIEGTTVGGRYNVSILDIVCGKKHYHEHETERRIVLDGNLIVGLNDREHFLTAGQMCRISPTVVHIFKSQNPQLPARLFAINFPAYDPKNFILAE